jgi:Ulp1 family protease
LTQILIKYSNYEITRAVARRMRPGVWLNDDLINFYMVLLQVCACAQCIVCL